MLQNSNICIGKKQKESRVIASDMNLLRKTAKYVEFEHKTNYNILKMWIISVKTQIK